MAGFPARILTATGEATLNTHLSRSGADGVANKGATVVHFIDNTGAAVAGASVAPTGTGTIEYPQLAGTGSGSSTRC